MSFSKTILVHTGRQYDVIIQRGILSVSGELIRKILPKAERSFHPARVSAHI